MITTTSDPKQTLTREQANAELYNLKQSILSYPSNTKGRAELLSDIKRAYRFLNTYRCEETLNSLMVREKQRDFDKFIKAHNLNGLNMIKTTVVNIKRTKDYGEYIGRGSIYGNPYHIGKDGSREEVIDKYKTWLKLKLRDPMFKKAVLRLKGKILGCYCKPLPCHGDILVDYIEKGGDV